MSDCSEYDCIVELSVLFCKQKTAYEMRISDWSSDVCSSDLPDPAVEANLANLRKLVAEKSLDFGVAFDGDGDRIGAIDGEGRVIWGDQLLQIYAAAVLKEMPGATVIADVKARDRKSTRLNSSH